MKLDLSFALDFLLKNNLNPKRLPSSTTDPFSFPRHLQKVLARRSLRTSVRPKLPLPESPPSTVHMLTPRLTLDPPPQGLREALLSPKPLCPMGSFNSAPKIFNEDTEDANVDLPTSLTQQELLDHCRRQLSPPPLIPRTVRILSNLADAESNPTMDTIRIFQWNLLSQSLGQNNDNFVNCPDEALEWSRRRHLIAEEIIRYNPDIICLQEVDHFKYLQKVLGTQGFRGMFMAKPDSPCLYIKGNNGPDGCAIFYRTERFQLIRSETRVLEVWRVQSNQVAVLVTLKDRISEEEICVATTHLKARSGALLSALRNEQGKDLLEWVAQQAGGRPLVLSGDFNAEPSEPIYSTILSHDLLRLTSAYACSGEEPPYTTWKIREEGEVCHTIDYMFCTKDRLQPVSLLEFPSGEEIGPDRIPSLAYPSDHFSLMCDFKLKSNDS